MEKFGLFSAACFSFTLVPVTQNNIVKGLEHNVPEQGKVSIHQDTRIETPIGSEYIPTDPEDQKVIRSSGYRVQVYAGNNIRQARDEAYSVASDMKERSPDLPVYISFNPPRWLYRAGDFRSTKETDVVIHQLRTADVSKEMSVVKDQINIPL